MTQFTATEKTVHDIDLTIKQGMLAQTYGKIKNPLLSDVCDSTLPLDIAEFTTNKYQDFEIGVSAKKAVSEPKTTIKKPEQPAPVKETKPAEDKKSFFGSSAKPSQTESKAKPQPKAQPQPKKNSLESMFANQSKMAKEPKSKPEKVVISEEPKKEEPEKEPEEESEEVKAKRAKNKEELSKMFNDDEDEAMEPESENEQPPSDVEVPEDEVMEDFPDVSEAKEPEPTPVEEPEADAVMEDKPSEQVTDSSKRQKMKKVKKKVTKVNEDGYLGKFRNLCLMKIIITNSS